MPTTRPIAVATLARGRLSPGMVPMNIGKTQLPTQPKNRIVASTMVGPWNHNMAIGPMTLRKHPAISTGLRPIRSESQGTRAPPAKAQIPRAPMIWPVTAGERPRTWVR